MGTGSGSGVPPADSTATNPPELKLCTKCCHALPIEQFGPRSRVCKSCLRQNPKVRPRAIHRIPLVEKGKQLKLFPKGKRPTLTVGRLLLIRLHEDSK